MAASPHDAIFKAVFTELDNATGVLRRMLPPMVDQWFSTLLHSDARKLMPEAIPDFRYGVMDLAVTSDSALRSGELTDEAMLTLWLLRDVRDAAAFSRGLAAWANVFTRLERHPEGREKITRLLHYVLWAGEDLQLEEIHAILEEAAPVAGEILMTTIAERLIAEGKARGLAEGKARGLAEGKARGLAEGLAEGKAASLLMVLEARGLVATAEQRARVEVCTDLDLLDQWTRKAATASSVDDVLS